MAAGAMKLPLRQNPGKPWVRVVSYGCDVLYIICPDCRMKNMLFQSPSRKARASDVRGTSRWCCRTLLSPSAKADFQSSTCCDREGRGGWY
eukprot:s849_g4.t1